MVSSFYQGQCCWFGCFSSSLCVSLNERQLVSAATAGVCQFCACGRQSPVMKRSGMELSLARQTFDRLSRRLARGMPKTPGADAAGRFRCSIRDRRLRPPSHNAPLYERSGQLPGRRPLDTAGTLDLCCACGKSWGGILHIMAICATVCVARPLRPVPRASWRRWQIQSGGQS